MRGKEALAQTPGQLRARLWHAVEESARKKSKYGSADFWPRREHLLPPMLPMQAAPNAAPVGLMFRTGGEVGVIVDHDVAYKVPSQEPTPFPQGFWKHARVTYVSAGSKNAKSGVVITQNNSRGFSAPTSCKRVTRASTTTTPSHARWRWQPTPRNKQRWPSSLSKRQPPKKLQSAENKLQSAVQSAEPRGRSARTLRSAGGPTELPTVFPALGRRTFGPLNPTEHTTHSQHSAGTNPNT